MRILGLFVLISCSALSGADAFAANDLKSSLKSGQLAAPSATGPTFENLTFPEGCGKPFQDPALFYDFYNSAINAMAAKSGSEGKGIPDLYAVSELRSDFQDLFPNFTDESPIDRLVIAQLCLYEKIRAQQMKPGAPATTLIQSYDVTLHEHLLAISTQLFTDARKIMVDSLSAQARLRQKNENVRSKWAEIRKAREAGRRKIVDLFN